MLVNKDLEISTGKKSYITTELIIAYEIDTNILEISLYVYIAVVLIERIFFSIFSERGPPNMIF